MNTISVTLQELDTIIAALRRYGVEVYNNGSKNDYEQICVLTKRLVSESK